MRTKKGVQKESKLRTANENTKINKIRLPKRANIIIKT